MSDATRRAVSGRSPKMMESIPRGAVRLRAQAIKVAFVGSIEGDKVAILIKDWRLIQMDRA